MILRTLGITGSAPGPESPASTYLLQVPAHDVEMGIAAGTVAADVEVRDWNILLDLGNGGLGMVLRYICVHNIDAVFLTHLHPDHCADLSGLYVHLRYHPVHGAAATGVMPALPVYGPSTVAQQIESICGVNDGQTMVGLYHFVPGSPGDTAAIGPFHVAAWRARHTLEAYALRVTAPSSRPELEGRRVALGYTGDTDISDDVIDMAQGVDLLLAEAAFIEGRDDDIAGVHLTGYRAGLIAEAAAAKSLLLTHIPTWNSKEQARVEAERSYRGSIALAEHDGCYVL